MTLPDASLSQSVVRPFWLGWLDIAGDVVRVTTLPYEFTPSGTGDADLDGFTFDSVPAAFIGVSAVNYSANGSDTVTATLSGIPGADDALLVTIGTPANWRGRTARIWRGLCDASGQPFIIETLYTGYMMKLSLEGDEISQTATVIIENYLALLTTPRRRTYQDQREHDALDQAPERIRAAANGIQTATGIGPGGGGGGSFSERLGQNIRLS